MITACNVHGFYAENALLSASARLSGTSFVVGIGSEGPVFAGLGLSREFWPGRGRLLRYVDLKEVLCVLGLKEPAHVESGAGVLLYLKEALVYSRLHAERASVRWLMGY